MEHLILWPFFREIEGQLSYERWIDKYKIFQQYLTAQPPRNAADWDDVRVLCRVLYLQEVRDRLKFEQLLDAAIEQEKAVWLQWAKITTDPKKDIGSGTSTGTGQSPTDAGDKPAAPAEKPGGEQEKDHKPTATDPVTRYFHPPQEQVFSEATFGASSASLNQNSGQFLHSDEYLPYTRRQMVKAWQRLRRRQQAGFSETLDLPATVKTIAQDGFLLSPAYRPGYINRPDTLLIFNDVRGSMTPFFEFSERLIHTAQHLGGHRDAGVFFFQNVPLTNVYRHHNLTGAVSLKAALQKANKQHTVAVVVSDAGAARGNADSQVQQVRLQQTETFLKLLREHTQKTLWFNPMPEHRWSGTCAEQIRNSGLVALMVPVFEHDALDPQEWIKKLIRY